MSAQKLLVAAGILVLVIAGVVVWIGGSLDALVKAGVEKYGSRITETEVSLASAKVEVRAGRGTLKGLRIANPPGFSDADAVRLGEITLDLDVASLGKEPVVLSAIRVAGPSLLLEVAPGGKMNLAAIRDAAERYAPPEAGGLDGSLAKVDRAAPRIVVKRLEFEGGVLQLDTSAVGGKKSERKLGSFTLEGLGGSTGIPADRLGREVLRTVVRRAIEESAGGELERMAKDKLRDAEGFLRSLAD